MSKIVIFGKKIAVLGQGGIGLSFTMFASKQGAAEVVGIDKHDYRLEKSISLGATKTIKYVWFWSSTLTPKHLKHQK